MGRGRDRYQRDGVTNPYSHAHTDPYTYAYTYTYTAADPYPIAFTVAFTVSVALAISLPVTLALALAVTFVVALAAWHFLRWAIRQCRPITGSGRRADNRECKPRIASQRIGDS